MKIITKKKYPGNNFQAKEFVATKEFNILFSSICICRLGSENKNLIKYFFLVFNTLTFKTPIYVS